MAHALAVKGVHVQQFLSSRISLHGHSHRIYQGTGTYMPMHMSAESKELYVDLAVGQLLDAHPPQCKSLIS